MRILYWAFADIEVIASPSGYVPTRRCARVGSLHSAGPQTCLFARSFEIPVNGHSARMTEFP